MLGAGDVFSAGFPVTVARDAIERASPLKLSRKKAAPFAAEIRGWQGAIGSVTSLSEACGEFGK